MTRPTPPQTPFDLALQGTLNGAALALEVQGVISPCELRFDVRPSAPGPLVGDFTLLALAAIDVPLLVATGARPLDEEVPWCSWVDVALRGEGGVLVGRLELAAEAEFVDDRLRVQAQLMRGEMRLEPGERVTRVEERAVVSAAAVEGALVSTRVFAVGTGRGRRLAVTCVGWEERGEGGESLGPVVAELQTEQRARSGGVALTASYLCRAKAIPVPPTAF